MNSYTDILPERSLRFETTTGQGDEEARASVRYPRLTAGYGSVVVYGTSLDGRKMMVSTEPTSIWSEVVSAAFAPLAGAVASVLVGMTPWRRGSESGNGGRPHSLYEQVALYSRRVSIKEARRRARQIQLSLDRMRLEFFAREAKLECDRAAWYDL